jgi:serine/threonine protein kinase
MKFNRRWALAVWAKCSVPAIPGGAVKLPSRSCRSISVPTPDLKQRFEREARAISSLNHPSVCTLHDIGSQDGVDFLVMECLEGETLAQRLKKGARPLKETLKIGIEICQALFAGSPSYH